MSGYHANILIYKINSEIIIPLAHNHNDTAKCGLGDYVIVMEQTVWVTNRSDEREEQFSQAAVSKEFIIKNKRIFIKQQ